MPVTQDQELKHWGPIAIEGRAGDKFLCKYFKTPMRLVYIVKSCDAFRAVDLSQDLTASAQSRHSPWSQSQHPSCASRLRCSDWNPPDCIVAVDLPAIRRPFVDRNSFCSSSDCVPRLNLHRPLFPQINGLRSIAKFQIAVFQIACC